MANKDVYEESKFLIKVKLKDGATKDADTAKLYLKSDGTEGAAITLEVKQQWIEYEHTFARVPDDKDNYPFEYRIEYDGEDKAGETTCTVWPRTANVKLVDEHTKQVLQFTRFRLLFTGDRVAHYVTEANGIGQCRLKHMATFTGRSTNEITFLGWAPGKDHGRNREARVERVEYLAVLESPKWKGQKIDQYVNLKTEKTGDEVGHDKLGRKVVFQVKLIDKNNSRAPIHPRGGERVYVKATLSELTKRNADLATFEGVTDLKRTGDVVTGYVATNAGKGKFTLALGLGGKEKCKLELGTTPECKDASVEFTNTRKIWIQPIAVAGKAPSFASATGWLANVGIELGTDTAADIDPDAQAAGALIPGTGFGEGDKQLIVGDHNVSQFTTAWTKEHDPHSAYAVFCDFQYDAGASEKKASGTYTIDGKKVFWIEPAGDSAAILTHSLHTGNFAVTGTWRSLAASGPHKDKTGAIDPANVTIDSMGDPSCVEITLPAAAAEVIDANEKVEYVVDVVYVKGPYNGWAPSAPRGGVVIALKNTSGARAAAGMNQTIVHEIGHLINQVSAPGAGISLTRNGDHKWHYTGRGHSGGHCAFGIAQNIYNGGGDLSGKGGTCVMFGEGANTRGGDFCVKCKPFVMAEPLESLT